MELSDVVDALRARVALILALGLFGLAAAVVPVLRYSATYTSSTQLFVSTPATSDSTTTAAVGTSFASTRLASYVRLVSTSAVRSRAVAVLQQGGGTVPSGTVGASSESGTVILTITAQATSAAGAERLADATATALSDYVSGVDKGASGTALVTLSVVSPAPPGLPSRDRRPYYLVGGLLGGLLLGSALALLQQRLDRTVHTSEDLRVLTGAPVLGVVPRELRQDGAAKLLTDLDVHAPRAEAFRQLRTNLAYVDAVRKPRSLVVTSALPGEGKSTTAINLALAMAANGTRILLVDADLRKPRIARYTGVTGEGPGLSDVLIGRATVQQAVRAWEPNASVLTCGKVPPNPSELLGSPEMRDLVTQLEGAWDLVLFDTPPLLAVTDAAVLSTLTAGALYVTAAERTTTDQVQAAVIALSGVRTPIVGAVLNNVGARSSEVRRYGYYGGKYGDEEKAAPSSPAARSRAPQPAAGR